MIVGAANGAMRLTVTTCTSYTSRFMNHGDRIVSDTTEIQSSVGLPAVGFREQSRRQATFDSDSSPESEGLLVRLVKRTEHEQFRPAHELRGVV